jgi:hypothetical protein
VTFLTVVVVIETIVLALLSVVVVSLLRSHAEVLRRLPEPDDEHDHDLDAQRIEVGGLEDRAAAEPTLPSHLPGPRVASTPAHDIAGQTLDGDDVAVSVSAGGPTLVAFLSSGCLTCRTFWEGLRPEVRRPLPGDARLVVVVKDRDRESPSKLRELTSPGVDVVHSSAAWEDYGVTMSPFFCFVDGSDIRSEGSAMTWDQVSSLLRDAILDEEDAKAGASKDAIVDVRSGAEV